MFNRFPAPRASIRRTLASSRPHQAAFTLIEIVIVMALVAILALMALPSLYGTTIRQQIKDSMPVADVAMRGVAAYYYANGDMPATNEAAGIPEAKKIVGNYVSAVTVKDGAVTVTYGNSAHAKLKGKRLTIRPAYVKDSRVVPIAWVCAARAVPKEMTVAGTNATDLAADSLPIDCR